MVALKKFQPFFLLSLFLSLILSTFMVQPAPALVANRANLNLTDGVTKTMLDNGLTVLTKEVHTAPVVSVQVWYRIGSRDEAPGVNGIAHQLEHLLFKGTKDRPIQFGRLFNALGSQFNAFTSVDQTAYFGTVQRDRLNAMLTLEADRMQNAVISEDHLASEKRVVISELQGYENSPEYRLNRAVIRAAMPNHPYGLPVGGTKADVEKFTVEQVRDYYQKYYAPGNTTVIVTGDFDTNTTLNTIRQTFGKIPARPTPSAASNSQANSQASATNRPTLDVGVTENRLRLGVQVPTSNRSATQVSTRQPIILREPGSAALMQLVYPLVDAMHPDVAAIDTMDMVLTGGRSSRLYQALIESGLASQASGYPLELRDPGWYEVSVTAAPGKDLATIEPVLQKTIAELRDRPISQEELNRAKTQLQTSYIYGNQDITSQAKQLGYNQTISGDYRYSDRYLQAIDKVTIADIQRVAKLYLDPVKQTMGKFEPTQLEGQAGGSSGSGGRTTENFNPGEPVDPAEVARYLPPVTTTTRSRAQALPETLTLDNGLNVLLLRDSSTPVVNLSGHVNAGTAFDPSAKAGLATLTAENLLSGTRSQDALSLAKSLEDKGASLSFSVNREGTSIGGVSLAPDLSFLVKTLADVLQQSTFPADKVTLSRQRQITAVKAQLDDPNYLGRRAFQQTAYPQNHPFHSFPTEATLNQIQQADVMQFYQTYYRPDATVLTLVGDFDPAQAKALLTDAFKPWQANGAVPKLSFPVNTLPRQSQRVRASLPGKSEAVTYLGYPAIARQDPRFYAALVLNQVLGGDTLSSRLGTEIRDRQGLTYGIYSYFQAGIQAGPFLVVMQTAPEDVDRAVESAIALLRQVRDKGITPEELETAKRSISMSYPVDLADPSFVASEITDNQTYGFLPEALRQFPEQVQAVTLEQVQKVIQELVQPDRLIIVTAGP
jgi:zinc protease